MNAVTEQTRQALAAQLAGYPVTVLGAAPLGPADPVRVVHE